MSKGDLKENKFYEYIDAFSGNKVIQLTSSNDFNHHPYFYNKSITNDNRYLIYGNKTKGTRNLFKMDLNDGTSVQLTGAEGINEFFTILSSDDRFIIYTKERQIIKLYLDSLEEDLIYEIPDGWSMNEENTPSLSSDDRFIVVTLIKSEDIYQAEGDWAIFVKQWHKMPRCRIEMIDIESKNSTIVCEEKYWMGQVQFRPNDNSTLSFCHEGPWQKVDARIWFINSDGSNLRCAKPREGKEQFGHEYWLKDGSKIGFMYFPRLYGRNATIRFIDPDTLEEEILMKCAGYSHCMSNHDNSRIVGDGNGTDIPYIYLIDVKNKKEEALCEHGTSWNAYGHTQDSHPHPTFSPDGSFIIFTSDKTGSPAIYKVTLER